MRRQIPTTNTILDLTNIDHVPSSGTHIGSNDMLNVFEDNEAVKQMITRGWSPTMRHVSRTHRVASDWLFDRIIVDSKIQIRYIDTKHQIADILTKGNFTRDEWNNLLHLFNISHFSSTCCAENSSLTRFPETMAKRMQEQKGEERSVAKSKSTAMYLSSLVPTSSSSAKSPIASKSPGILIASGKPESRMRRNSESDAVLNCGCKMHTLTGWWTQPRGNLSLQKKESGDVDISESETWSYQEEAVLARPTDQKKSKGKTQSNKKIRATGKSKSWKDRIVTQSTRVSSQNSPYGSSLLDRQEDLRTSTWKPYGWFGREYGYLGIFLNATLRAAVHVGQDYEANSRYVKHNLWNSVGQLFNETGKLISEQKEITGVSTTKIKDATWMSTSLLCGKAYQITNAKA